MLEKQQTKCADGLGTAKPLPASQYSDGRSGHKLSPGKKRKREDNATSRSVGLDHQGKHTNGSKIAKFAGTPVYVNGHVEKANGASVVPWTRPKTSPVKRANGVKPKENGDVTPRKAAVHTQGRGQGNRLTARRQELLEARKKLPIWPHEQLIRKSLGGTRDVLILVGETGSGKSTQVPQMLVRESWCQGRVAITQPRRVAAISLARRVAEEMGTPLGSSSPSSAVGYSVRFDNSTSPATKIKFLTEGMLLQEMLRDPWLKEYSVVIIDEVHERGVNVDLLLGFLRNLVAGNKKRRDGKPLKVVIMSATADTEALFRFFSQGRGERHPPTVVNGNASTTEEDAASETSWSGISSSEDDLPPLATPNSKLNSKLSNGVRKPESVPRATNDIKLQKHDPRPLTNAMQSVSAVKNQSTEITNGETSAGARNIELSSEHISTCYIEGRQYPVQIMYLPEPTLDFVEASLKSIFQIHCKEPLPGDILVFLTGQDTVENLESLVKEYALGLGPDLPKLLVLPLFAALPQTAQQRIFEPAPPRTRKVILATNIAETSVTVPGVRYVVDCGKAKIKQFRNRLGLDSLLVKPISKSAAIQRKGRAGRESPGKCYRLYTEKEYLNLQPSNTPEILRCDLSQSILTMKARGVDDVINFPFLDRPPREALEKALLHLFHLKALDKSAKIGAIGRQMAKLPLPPSLGRVIIAAAQPDADCLLEVIDIISCLSVENIFMNLTTDEKKEEAENARRDLYRREGDHLILLATVQAYAAERTDRRAWAEKHFVLHRAVQNVMDIRKQLRAQCQQQKLLTSIPDEPRPYTLELASRILKAFLKGFAANTARLMPDSSYKTIIGNQTVAIHPSSALYGKKVEAIMYNEFVFTNRSYGRNVSAVQMDWVGEALGG